MSQRPVIALSGGDPAGVGPEIIVKALARQDVHDQARIVVLGDPGVTAKAVKLLGLLAEINIIENPDQGLYRAGTIDLIPCSHIDVDKHSFGHTGRACGEAAYQAVVKAVELIKAGRAQALTTAPLAKSSLHRAGHEYPGHTELLAELSNKAEPVMCLAGPRIKVTLVTTHLPLQEVPQKIGFHKIVRVAELTVDLLNRLGLESPRIGVCGLNPHAGEDGLFGSEDKEIIAPAVMECQSRGLSVSGPEPADTVFVRASRGEFQAVVAMYHDQGLIPLKLLHFDNAVNTTLGLDLVRTSVDHGTAFDIAGQGKADPSSLIAALRMAAALISPGERRGVWD